MDLAGKLTSGVDVWLNTPLPPMEASGTSGMKAAFNGVMNFSVLDGWWVEGCVEGVTGWAIGPGPDEPVTEEQRRAQELRDLYNKLEYVILPLYYSMEDEWTHRMKNAVGLIAYYFNSHVMMRRYASEAYLLELPDTPGREGASQVLPAAPAFNILPAVRGQGGGSWGRTRSARTMPNQRPWMTYIRPCLPAGKVFPHRRRRTGFSSTDTTSSRKRKEIRFLSFYSISEAPSPI